MNWTGLKMKQKSHCTSQDILNRYKCHIMSQGRCQKHPKGGVCLFFGGGGLKISTKNGGRVDISNKKWGEAKERKQKMGGG